MHYFRVENQISIVANEIIIFRGDRDCVVLNWGFICVGMGGGFAFTLMVNFVSDILFFLYRGFRTLNA